MHTKKILWQIITIILISCLICVGVNFSLIRKYFKGEFALSFISSEKYPAISFITLAEAENLFVTQNAVFIDSRERDEYISGHILGALNIPYEDRDSGLSLEEPGLSLQDTLVVYCDGSECQSSIQLAKLLDEYGFKDIRVFFGGWQEWVDAGLPVLNYNDSQ
ncbi:MAG: rhodanese-like domain-containing protein [Candidatus Aminicenantaceae bacterium]